MMEEKKITYHGSLIHKDFRNFIRKILLQRRKFFQIVARTKIATYRETGKVWNRNRKLFSRIEDQKCKFKKGTFKRVS